MHCIVFCGAQVTCITLRDKFVNVSVVSGVLLVCFCSLWVPDT